MSTSWLIPDRRIWVRNHQNEHYFPAVVTKRNEHKQQVECVLEPGKETLLVTFDNCHQRSPLLKQYEDMCSMDILNEPEILHNLKDRFKKELIYTKIG